MPPLSGLDQPPTPRRVLHPTRNFFFGANDREARGAPTKKSPGGRTEEKASGLACKRRRRDLSYKLSLPAHVRGKTRRKGPRAARKRRALGYKSSSFADAKDGAGGAGL